MSDSLVCLFYFPLRESLNNNFIPQIVVTVIAVCKIIAKNESFNYIRTILTKQLHETEMLSIDFLSIYSVHMKHLHIMQSHKTTLQQCLMTR